MNRIEIWAPKWSTRTVLIAARKVKADNIIAFTKTPSLGNYYMSGEMIKSYPISTNGKIPCYAVNLDELLERPIE